MDVKQVKEQFRRIASETPEKYFGVDTLQKLGYTRKKCTVCGKYFWSVTERTVCGDPVCQGGFTFINEEPFNQLSYINVWKEFSRIFEKLGYTPISRYPVVARWRDDTDFVQASIYDFQPHVVSGAVDPPANPLVVPQFSLRFVDVENVGITGSHYTGFVMIGQHAFERPEKYDQNVYLDHIYQWLHHGLKIPPEELVFHEDGWAGGGNGGACMEYFCQGLELGNQVYMLYTVTPSGYEELDLKVLDMGMGQERNAWFCSQAAISYEAVFPEVLKYMYKKTGITPDYTLLKKFAPYAGLFNVDEVDDIEAMWSTTAHKLEIDKNTLKTNIGTHAAFFAVAEHTRGLLIALSDGALPSNVGGGYNLRGLLRRCLNIIENHHWDLQLKDICEKHAQTMSAQYPELLENLEDVFNIIDVEKKKYKKAKKTVERELKKAISKKEITKEKLIELYQSHGVNPDLLEKAADKAGISFSFSVPAFIETEKGPEPEHRPSVFPPYETEELYYKNESLREFTATVVDTCDNLVVLDKTGFYPTGGGQENDTGVINDKKVVDVTKEGKTIIHKVQKGSFKTGEKVTCVIDTKRRDTLTRHHTAAHLVNGAARTVLGNHVWQAGSHISEHSGRLDITHYQRLTPEELKEIEVIANQKVLEGLPVYKQVLDRTEAEQKYGFRLYQGGAVPGKVLRVLNIPGFDVEACGGTHVDNTYEIGIIKILGYEKISDSVLRLEFASGLKALEYIQKDADILQEVADVFKVEKSQLVKTAQRFFDEWKLKSKEIESLKKELSDIKKIRLKECFIEKDGLYCLEEEIEGDRDILRETGINLLGSNTVIVLYNRQGDLVVLCGEEAVEKGFKADKIVKEHGRGGGSPDFAQGVKEKEEKE
ncbi:MAG: alanine--tRNA ligase [Candidatus Methanofastidiosia archaeon]|jgi:alanyl-tRNA synthetase